jgi:hypothetical protein
MPAVRLDQRGGDAFAWSERVSGSADCAQAVFCNSCQNPGEGGQGIPSLRAGGSGGAFQPPDQQRTAARPKATDFPNTG